MSGATLAFNGQTTANLAHDASAGAVQAALESLSTIGAGNVSVSGDFDDGFTVEFVGVLADANVPELSAVTTLAIHDPEYGPGVTVSPQGVAAVNEVQHLQIRREYFDSFSRRIRS